jgi:hypothetical protein
MKNLILIFFSFILLSCNNDDDVAPVVTPPFVPVVIEPILISKRDITPNVINPQKTVIDTNEEWNALLNQIDNFYQPFGIDFMTLYFSESIIDFNNYTIITVFDQVYNNGGHSVDIMNITEFEDNIKVTVENLQTGNTSNVGTQPYHIVKIPKATKPIVFE